MSKYTHYWSSPKDSGYIFHLQPVTLRQVQCCVFCTSLNEFPHQTDSGWSIFSQAEILLNWKISPYEVFFFFLNLELDHGEGSM